MNGEETIPVAIESKPEIGKLVLREAVSWLWVILAFLFITGTIVQARVIPSGGNIVLNGAGFGQPCSECTVTLYPGGAVLPVSSWTPNAITVTLPALSGLVQLTLQATTGRDTINIMTAAPPSPTSSATPSPCAPRA